MPMELFVRTRSCNRLCRPIGGVDGVENLLEVRRERRHLTLFSVHLDPHATRGSRSASPRRPRPHPGAGYSIAGITTYSNRPVEYLLKQYGLQQGALEIQYIE